MSQKGNGPGDAVGSASDASKSEQGQALDTSTLDRWAKYKMASLITEKSSLEPKGEPGADKKGADRIFR